MKRRAIVFGAGQNFSNMKETILRLYDVIAVTDSAAKKWGNMSEGFCVQSPAAVIHGSEDAIIVTPSENEEIIETLLKDGIDPLRIIKLTELCDKAFQGLKLHMAIIFYGGMGDFLIGKNWLYHMAEKYNFEDIITDVYLDTSTYERGKAIFENDKLIDSVRSIWCDYTSLMDLEYDVAFRFHIVPYVQFFHGEKVAACKAEFLEYLVKLQEFGLKHYGIGFCHNPTFYKRMREVMELLPEGKYHNFCDVFGNLDIKDRYLFGLSVNKDSKEYLKKVGLAGNRFITIDTGQNVTYMGKSNTRLWPYECWNRLARLVKSRYPDYKIVQVGANGDASDVFADVHLNGKTDMEDMKILLRDAVLHIDYDGGLVHVRHILGGGPSVVLFGPTVASRHSYDENIAVYTETCSDCEWTTDGWLYDCPRGMRKPVCMYSITPEVVYEKASAYLESIEGKQVCDA